MPANTCAPQRLWDPDPSLIAMRSPAAKALQAYTAMAFGDLPICMRGDVGLDNGGSDLRFEILILCNHVISGQGVIAGFLVLMWGEG